MNKNKVTKRLLLYGLLVAVAAYFYPRPRDWTPYLTKDKRTPFGNEILYKLIGDLFPEYPVYTNQGSLYEKKDSLHQIGGNLIFIQDQLDMDSLDLDVLLHFAASGNSVFISSSTFPSKLLDTLGYNINYNWTGSSILSNIQDQDTIFHQFYPISLSKDTAYNFTTEYSLKTFTSLDSLNKHTAIGWAKNKEHPIMVREKYGAGSFILHTNPYCFTNYYMLKDHQREYIGMALSFMKPGPIIWDEYYNPYNSKKRNRDLLTIVKAKPSLAWAYYIGITGIILYLLFMSKRKQRRIPILDSFPNESMELVNTIGQLYFNTSTNKNIAEKKINLIYVFLHRNIGMDKSMSLAQQKHLITSKTTLSSEEVEQVLKLINNLQAQEIVSNGQMKALQKYGRRIRKEFSK